MKPGRYESRPLAFLLLGMVLFSANFASAAGAHGLALPQGSQEVGENRFRAPGNYEDTLKYFTTIYKGIPRKAVVNQPGIRAVHFESYDPRSAYEGFNVYEKDKEVRIFVILREGQKEEKKKAAKKGSR